MTDQRITRYAELLVDTCVGVQAGWQVLVAGTPLGRPLLEEVARLIGQREAYAIMRVGFGGSLFVSRSWLREAPLEVISTASSIEVDAFQKFDALIAIEAPENTREASSIDQERLAALQTAYRPAMERIFQGTVPWVGCQYPTPALAQDAGMSTDDFADFLYGACLLDWEVERERMQRHADLFDAASEVRIVGDGDRSATQHRRAIDARRRRWREHPGWRVLRLPGRGLGRGRDHVLRVPGDLRRSGDPGDPTALRGRQGRRSVGGRNEDFLLTTIDQDAGARYLGELGIGCNPGITRYMKNVLFDEKIDGTMHLALGNSVSEAGGTNESSIHWDIVKDLRKGGRIELDGVVVQQDGAWV